MKIIDGNNMLHREAEPVGRGMHPVRHIFNKYCAPNETTIIVWDGPYGNQRRKDLYPEYKGNRRPKEESKHKFFEIAKAVLRFTPIIQVECKGWEADDVIGTLLTKLHKDHEITVESNDGDFWQFSKMAKLPLISKKWKWMTPNQLLLYKATVGDPKDNIPGLKGFGHKFFISRSKESQNRLTHAIKTESYDHFLALTHDWPKRIKRDVESFGQLCLWYKLNTFMDVPEQEIDEGTFQGVLNVAAAEIFMENYLI